MCVCFGSRMNTVRYRYEWFGTCVGKRSMMCGRHRHARNMSGVPPFGSNDKDRPTVDSETQLDDRIKKH